MGNIVVVITRKVRNQQVNDLIDSGSTGNFVSLEFVEQSGLKMDENDEKLILTYGSQTLTKGTVNFIFKSGSMKCQIHTQVFPYLHKPMVVGMPWLRKMNPQTNWSEGIITVQQDGKMKILQREEDTQSEQINFIPAKQMQSILQKGQFQRAFIGIIRRVEDKESIIKENPEMDKTSSKGNGPTDPTNITGIFGYIPGRFTIRGTSYKHGA